MNLVDKLKTGARKAVLIGGLIGMLTFGACKPIMVNYPPVIESTPQTQVDEEEDYNYQVEATDADKDVLEYSLTESPDWLAINSTTGLISGTAPSVNLDTEYPVEVKVSDGQDVDTQEYDLLVKNQEEPEEPINHSPKIISNPSITQINEDADYNYQVEATDADKDVLEYSLTESPDWLTINSTTGLISGTAPHIASDTSYEIVAKVSDGKDFTEQSFSLLEKNLLEISGRLQDNETDTNQAGEIRVYDLEGDLKKTHTTLDGDFNIQLDDVVSEAILQSRLDMGGYIRTVKLSGDKDHFDLIVRAVPYDDFGVGITKEQFKEHVEDVNLNDPAGSGLSKWDLSWLQGIEILRYNPVEGNDSFFTNDQQDFIIARINDPEDVWSYVENKNLNGDEDGWIDIQKDTEEDPSEKHYFVENYTVYPNVGWIIVTPDNDMEQQGEGISSSDNSHLGYYVKGRIRLKFYDSYPDKNSWLISHEFGHVLGPYMHSDSASPESIMKLSSFGDSSGALITPSFADKKTSYITCESTYLPYEISNDILGLNWLGKD